MQTGRGCSLRVLLSHRQEQKRCQLARLLLRLLCLLALPPQTASLLPTAQQTQ